MNLYLNEIEMETLNSLKKVFEMSLQKYFHLRNFHNKKKLIKIFLSIINNKNNPSK